MSRRDSGISKNAVTGLKEMLSRDDLKDSDYPPQAFKLAEEHLGNLLKDVSPSVLQQEKRLWATIESLDWFASYVEDLMHVQESFLRHYAERSDEYREMIALSERIVALDGLPEDSLHPKSSNSSRITYTTRGPARCLRTRFRSVQKDSERRTRTPYRPQRRRWPQDLAPRGGIYLSTSGKTALTIRLHTPQTVDGLFRTAGPAATIHLATALRGRVNERTVSKPPVPA
jgi:hypothetical protein